MRTVLPSPLPPAEEMYAAIVGRDPGYEGTFFFAVRTTGVFCRPGCGARTPRRENVDFFPSSAEAVAEGYRPCRRCRPLELRSDPPAPIGRLLEALQRAPGRRIRDRDLRDGGLDPAAVRRWFERHHGMTFHRYQRAGRIGRGVEALARGTGISTAAFGSGYDSLSAFQDALKSLTGRTPTQSRETMIVHTVLFPTPLGPMILGEMGGAICLLEFSDLPRAEFQMERLARRLGAVLTPGSTPAIEQAREELREYFAGERRSFSVPLLAPGTDFQEGVWKALQEIPYGATQSYGEVARRIGAPKAVRAVAQANGANRLAILIPCHRVIGADGTLTGYGGGMARKRFLLGLEGAALDDVAAEGRAPEGRPTQGSG